MAAFDKSAVDVAELAPEELTRVLGALGFGTIGATKKLTNGGCAANYICEVDGQSVVLKAIPGSSAEEAQELAGSHLEVLRALTPPSAPTAVPADQTLVTCKTTSGQPAAALSMSLLQGEAANILMRQGLAHGPDVFAALGAALAAVHRATPPAGLADVSQPGYVERYIRCEAPLEARLPEWQGSDGHGFLAWMGPRLAPARAALTTSGLPRGLLHGDPFMDNVLLQRRAEGGFFASLVDFEDSGVGPLVYDLAVAAVGGCFVTATADKEVAPEAVAPAPLKADEFGALIGSYAASRGLSAAEASAVRPLMGANAWMCACYRWYSFHVSQTDAPESAKGAHLEMVSVLKALEEEATRSAIDGLLAPLVR